MPLLYFCLTVLRQGRFTCLLILANDNTAEYFLGSLEPTHAANQNRPFWPETGFSFSLFWQRQDIHIRN